MKNFLILFFASMLSYGAIAQEAEGDIYELSLEDLMEIDIYSVSKKAESLFDAPLSSTALTADEIYNSGATSIPEALRLIPGLIVREVSNGIYDVHLRGLDNLIRYGNGAEASNTITLVMIDGRPVFNNNIGGVYWEALPIALIDVERIEVVRGPSAPLYGPNAVAGVINIITKKIQDEGLAVNANLRGGNAGTYLAGVHVGNRFSDKFSISLSGNMEKRDRHDSQYFSYTADDYIDYNGLISDSDGTAIPANYIQKKERALERTGANIFVDYTPNEDVSLQWQLGGQHAVAQKIARDNAYTPFTESEYMSGYISFIGNIHGLKAQIARVGGYDNLNVGSTFPLLEYDYNTTNIFLEYDINLTDNLSLRPGINYQSAQYSDKDYIDVENAVIGVLNSNPKIRTYAGSLSANYQLSDKLRFTGGIRADKFNSPDDIYISYQFASTFKANDKNLLRLVYAKSNSGSFIGSNFVNIDLPYTDPATGTQILYYFQGNSELDLFQIDMLEFGYRTKISSNVELNLETWLQRAQNSYTFFEGVAPPPYYADLSYYYTYENTGSTTYQSGLTLSANIVPNTKLHIKPFVTYQQTETEDLPTFYHIANTNKADVVNDQTPSIFGGLYMNFTPNDKFSINLNPYYMSAQTHYSFYNLANPNTELGDIDAKLILNARLSYKPSKVFDIYLSARNFTNNDSREYGGGDRTGALLLGGVNVKL